MTVKVYNQEGAEIGTVELAEAVFGIEPNEAVVHQYVVNYLARQRQGNASTKTRSDVTGGGRKPWRQKGTGRARAGTIRSPLWHGGGTVFGPHPKEFDPRFPKRMKRLAIKSVFSDKAKTDKIKVVDRVEFPEIKTKRMIDLLGKLELEGKKCLILDGNRNDNLSLACRNLPGVKYRPAETANGYDVLNAEFVLFTRSGLEKVQEVFS